MSKESYQLFKSDLRGIIKGNQRASFITFNEGAYFHESRNRAGILTQFSEHYLSGESPLEFFSQNDSFLILPIEGELSVNTREQTFHIHPQELFVLSPDQQIQISNCFPDEFTRFYVIQLSYDTIHPSVHSFLPDTRNQLISCYESPQLTVSIGIFDGRKDGKINTSSHNTTFVTIINGAFEVQNRLMETNDSLLAIDCTHPEFEALSENAVILVLSF